MMTSKRQFGVYGIRCESTRKVYIGSTRRSFKQRWSEHRRELNYGYSYTANAQLRADWRRFGSDAFSFFVIEVVENPAQVRARERFWYHAYAQRTRLYNAIRVIPD